MYCIILLLKLFYVYRLFDVFVKTVFTFLHGIASTYIADLIEVQKSKRSLLSYMQNLIFAPRTKSKSRGDRVFAVAIPKSTGLY